MRVYHFENISGSKISRESLLLFHFVVHILINKKLKYFRSTCLGIIITQLSAQCCEHFWLLFICCVDHHYQTEVLVKKSNLKTNWWILPTPLMHTLNMFCNFRNFIYLAGHIPKTQRMNVSLKAYIKKTKSLQKLHDIWN